MKKDLPQVLDHRVQGQLKLPDPTIIPLSDLMSDLIDLRVIRRPPENSSKPTIGESRGGADVTRKVDLIVIPSVRGPLTEEVWHYTNTDGVLGIISTNTIWATSIAFLNDRLEFQYGRELLNGILDEVRDSAYIHPVQKKYIIGVSERSMRIHGENSMYLVCASEAEDSLNQWKGYGEVTSSHGLGHAIGLDAKFNGVVLTNSDSEILTDPVVQSLKWGSVLYDEESQRKLILEMLGNIAGLIPDLSTKKWEPGERERHEYRQATSLLEILLHCKHPSFSDEKEVRMIFSVPDGNSSLFHRSGTFGVTPHLKIAFIDPTDFAPTTVPPLSTSTAQKLPIRSIMTGPAREPGLSKVGLQSLLSAHGYSNVNVMKTSTPYR